MVPVIAVEALVEIKCTVFLVSVVNILSAEYPHLIPGLILEGPDLASINGSRNNSTTIGWSAFKSVIITLFILACPYGIVKQKFRFQFKKGSSKNFLWASRLWVGRRKEPILGYVPKNYKKKNSGSKELRLRSSESMASSLSCSSYSKTFNIARI